MKAKKFIESVIEGIPLILAFTLGVIITLMEERWYIYIIILVGVTLLSLLNQIIIHNRINDALVESGEEKDGGEE